jgi:hypothetical protein
MKGTAPRPSWPLSAAAAAHPKAAGTQEQTPESENRITLAILEEHSLSPEHARGYDPYNAVASRAPYSWRRKR